MPTTPEPDVDADERRARWSKLPPRVLPDGSSQPDPRVPDPDDPHREAIYAGG
jgi:hypothetical protein